MKGQLVTSTSAYQSVQSNDNPYQCFLTITKVPIFCNGSSTNLFACVRCPNSMTAGHATVFAPGFLRPKPLELLWFSSMISVSFSKISVSSNLKYSVQKRKKKKATFHISRIWAVSSGFTTYLTLVVEYGPSHVCRSDFVKP